MNGSNSNYNSNKEIEISLKKYHYRYLGALERDLDSFNRQTGLPIEICEALHRLHALARHSPPTLFLRSPLLKDFTEFLLKMPEGLVPSYYATRIVTGRNDPAIRRHLKSLPLENYCALRFIVIFVKSISFNSITLVPFEEFDKATGLCEAITPTPRDDRFKPMLISIFKDPTKFFCSTQRNNNNPIDK